MTTPEPVAPLLPTRTSIETTAGVTRVAMSATEPGSRVTPGSTSDSWVPGYSSGGGAEPGRRLRIAPRIGPGVGLPPGAGGGAAAPGPPLRRLLQPGAAGTGR